MKVTQTFEEQGRRGIVISGVYDDMVDLISTAAIRDMIAKEIYEAIANDKGMQEKIKETVTASIGNMDIEAAVVASLKASIETVVKDFRGRLVKVR